MYQNLSTINFHSDVINFLLQACTSSNCISNVINILYALLSFVENLLLIRSKFAREHFFKENYVHNQAICSEMIS